MDQYSILELGIKSYYAATILIALGSFSIHAFIILWKSISLRTGLTIWAMVISFALLDGVLTKLAESPLKAYNINGIKSILADSKPVSWDTVAILPAAQPLSSLNAKIRAQEIAKSSVGADFFGDAGEINIRQLAMQSSAVTADDKKFELHTHHSTP